MYVSNSTGGLMLQTMLYLANQTSKAAVNTILDMPMAPKSDANEIKCYGVYGCFPLNGPWISVTRQFNVHPQKPSEIEPHFTLYTRRAFDNPRFIDLNDPEAIVSMDINPAGKIFFVAHGYLESGIMPWMLEMGKTLLQHEPEGETAVVLIDWGGGSSPPYVQAVANIRLVGAITAHIIHLLYEELHLPNLSNVHIIGHSLGSHLAGYAGYHLQRDFGLKLGRITGLDPAAPLFTETDRVVRLDRSDAEFVDIIHTDANPLIQGGLGIHNRIGHVDFYPNGGFDNPGCNVRLEEYMKNKDNSLLLTMQQFLGCNHIRSYMYFMESLRSKCPFLGITCESYEKMKEGKCFRCGENNHQCMRMGYHSYEDYQHLVQTRSIGSNSTPVFYLMTSGKKPFCSHHYRITVKVSSHDESALHGGEVGTISLRLHASKSQATDRIKFSSKPMYFEPGFEYHSLVTGQAMRQPIYATAFWDYQTSLLNPLTWRLLSAPRIYIDYMIIESMEMHDLRLKLCPLSNNAIISGSENVLHPKYCA